MYYLEKLCKLTMALACGFVFLMGIIAIGRISEQLAFFIIVAVCTYSLFLRGLSQHKFFEMSPK
jgi:4-hydroxybenzoate polyprenyltransferase